MAHNNTILSQIPNAIPPLQIGLAACILTEQGWTDPIEGRV